jgi:hypothetical protein
MRLMTSRFLFLGLFLPLAALPYPGRAEEPAVALRVIRPILHAERESAEMCLEFDHALDAVGNAARVAASLHVETSGRTVPMSSRNISFAENQMCLSPFEHRKEYRLTLGGLRGATGEKLFRAYSLSFAVPARRPALAFINKEGRSGLMLWRDNPVLHSVNSARITLELYRIADPARMVEAWRLRKALRSRARMALWFGKAS